MGILAFQEWIEQRRAETIESRQKPLSEAQWEEAWKDLLARISLRGLCPDELSSLWIFGSDGHTAAFLERLSAQLTGLKQIVIIDGEAELQANFSPFKFAWSEQQPQLSLECAPLSDHGWVEQYTRFASRIQESGQHPRNCLPLDLSKGKPAMNPSLRAANELFLGYGLSSGQALLEELSASSRGPQCLEQLLQWCLYLNTIGEYLPCALLGVPLYALSLQPAMGTLLVSAFSNLGCPELSLEWLGKSDLDFRARKEFAQVLREAVRDGAAQSERQREYNLRRLAAKQPHLAQFARTTRPPSDLHCVYTTQIPWRAPLRGSHKPVAKAVLPVLLRARPQSLEILANLDHSFPRQLQELSTIKSYRCVLGNIAALDVMANLEMDKFSTSLPNWSKEITLIIEDPELATKLLELEHPAVELLFQDGVRFLWGPGAQQYIASEISSVTSRAIPDLLSGVGPTFRRRLAECASRRHRLLHNYLRTVKLTRQGKSPSATLDKLERGEVLNILVPTSMHTSVLQYVAKDLCQAFESLGHNVKLQIEADGRHEISSAVWAEAMQEFSPDIVVYIDVLRAHMDSIVPDHIPSVCWILDEMPRLEDPETIAKISPSDLTFVWGYHLIEKYKGTLGYPHCETLPFAVSPDVYCPQESIVASNSLAYITNVGGVGEPKGFPGLWDRLTQEFQRRGNARMDVAGCKTLLCALIEQGPWTLSSSDDLSSLSYQVCQYARWYDRVSVAKSLAEAKIPIALYGKGWDAIPELASFAKGSVAQGAELSRVYQSHKVVLHINQNCNVHPRVLECMLAGTLVIARSNGEEDRVKGGLNDYLEIDREICVFEKTEDLVETTHRAFQDEEWRQGMISAGRARVLRDHSYLARAQAILNEFRRVLAQNAQTGSAVRRSA